MTERKYPIRNTITNSTFSVPLRDYAAFMKTVDTATGKPMFEAMSDIPGIVTGYDGSQQAMIPKERVREALGERGALRVLKSDDDPSWEAARASAVQAGKERVAKDRSGALVMTDALLSGITFGGSSKVANMFAGEDAEELRALGITEHGAAQFGGRALSLLALGLLPIPGLGASVGAAKGLRVGSIFETAGKAANVARKAVPGQGFLSELGKRFVGPVAFGAVADAPLSAAMVAADIVDYDKELTGDAIASDFLTQYGLSVTIAAVTSLPFALIGAGARTAGRAAVGKGDELLGRAASVTENLSPGQKDILDAAVKGGWRYTSRKYLRGKGHGFGDATDMAGYKVWSKITKKHPGRIASESPIGRLLAGDAADDYIKLNITNQELIRSLQTSQTAKQMRKTVDLLIRNNRNPELDESLAFIRNHADDLIAGRRKAQTLIMDSRRLAEQYQKATYKHPVGLDWTDKVDVAKILNRGVKAIGEPEITSGQFPQRLDKALNIYKAADTAKRKPLRDAIVEAFPDMEKYMKQIDNAELTAREVIRMTDDFGPSGNRLFDEVDLIGLVDERGAKGVSGMKDLRATMRGLDNTLRSLSDDSAKIVDRAPFLASEKPFYTEVDGKTFSLIDSKFAEIRDGVAAMAKANNAFEALKYDARPLFKAPGNMTQEQILAAQVQSVMSTKERIGEALWYIAMKGGGARHTATFGGVYTYRSMGTFAEKRTAFRMIHDAVTQKATNVETLMAHVGDMVGPAAAFDMGLGASLAANQIAAYSYLNAQMPRSADRLIGPEDFSGAEIDNFLEAVGALAEPISVLATAADGSTTGQAVDAIRTVYPRLYTEMALDVAEFVEEYGDKLDHVQLLGLDTFLNGALGYSDGPAPELTFQEPMAQTQQQARAIGGPENRRMSMQVNMTPAQKVGGL